MPVNCAERPGSSQGRGGNTQQEHDLLYPRSLCTNKFVHLSEKLQDVESILKKHVGNKHVIGEDVRGILEIVMATIDPKLAEKNVIDVIADYDVTTTRVLIATLRRKIERLRDRIGSANESRVTKWILGLTLASKVKTLEEQQDTLTSTPPSSDDEEDDEDDRDACSIAEDCEDEQY